MLDEGTEWRTFADEKSNRVNPDRVGAAQSVLFSGDELGTRITGIGTGNTGTRCASFTCAYSTRACDARITTTPAFVELLYLMSLSSFFFFFLFPSRS